MPKKIQASDIEVGVVSKLEPQGPEKWLKSWGLGRVESEKNQQSLSRLLDPTCSNQSLIHFPPLHPNQSRNLPRIGHKRHSPFPEHFACRFPSNQSKQIHGAASVFRGLGGDSTDSRKPRLMATWPSLGLGLVKLGFWQKKDKLHQNGRPSGCNWLIVV